MTKKTNQEEDKKRREEIKEILDRFYTKETRISKSFAETLEKLENGDLKKILENLKKSIAKSREKLEKI